MLSSVVQKFQPGGPLVAELCPQCRGRIILEPIVDTFHGGEWDIYCMMCGYRPVDLNAQLRTELIADGHAERRDIDRVPGLRRGRPRKVPTLD